MNAHGDLEQKLDRLGEEIAPRQPFTEKVMQAVRASDSPPQRRGILRRIGIMKPAIGTAIAIGFLVFLGVSKEEPPEDRAFERSISAELDSRTDANRGPLSFIRRWGYLDREGNIVIEPRFYRAYDFHEGLAIVNVGGRGQDVDQRRLARSPSPNDVDSEDKGPMGVIDRTGTLVVEPRFGRAFHFQEGTAAVMVDGKWGFIDRRGEYVIEPRFDEASPFQEGRANVRIGKQWGFIDRKGDFAVEPVYDYVGHFSEGLGNVAVSNPKGEGWIRGFVDMNGREVIKPQYRHTGEFSEGYVAVRTEDLWGYIDRDGNQKIPYQFKTAGPFRNGLAKVELPAKPNMFGMIDKSGTMVVEPIRYYGGYRITPDGTITAYHYDPKTNEKIAEPFDMQKIWAFPDLYYPGMDIRDGRTTIQIGGTDPPRYAAVDQNGDIVFTTDPDEISYVRPYSEGLAVFGMP